MRNLHLFNISSWVPYLACVALRLLQLLQSFSHLSLNILLPWILSFLFWHVFQGHYMSWLSCIGYTLKLSILLKLYLENSIVFQGKLLAFSLWNTIVPLLEYYEAERKKELLPFVTAWMELESITLSKISQVKDKYHMISPISGT